MNLKTYGRIYITIFVILLAMLSIGACGTVSSDNNLPYPDPNPNSDQVINTATPVVSPMPSGVPQKIEVIYQEIGILWQECNLTDKNWQNAEACLGFIQPDWSEGDRQRLGEQNDVTGGLRQTIGNDVYETMYLPDTWNSMRREYVLLKNTEVIATITGTFTGYDPNRSLLNVGGKIVWEFADPEHPTVIYDGRDVRSEYNVEAAYIPYDIGGKLLFVARENGKYYLIYDGQKLGPEFDEISIAYCCEFGLYSIRHLQGQYWFWGSRNGQNYIVVISAIR